MDAKPYKVVEDLYHLFKSTEGHLDDKQIGYVTGAFKTLLDLYWEPTPEDEIEKRPFKFSDISKIVTGEK